METAYPFVPAKGVTYHPCSTVALAVRARYEQGMGVRWDLHERNRQSWNAATEAHLSHKANRAEFLRNGGSTLYPEECELLGDLAGRRLLHVQCNAGEDTLSLAAMGAEVTGVDISEKAIEAAEDLSEKSQIAGSFVRADLYQWLAETGTPDHYDVVFSSYGALCWLSDVKEWARGIARVLAPGGRLVVIDTHPVLMMFNEQWKLSYNYQGGEAVETSGVGDYVGESEHTLTPGGRTEGVKDFKNPHPDYTFQWGVGEIVGALIQGGLVVETMREYTFANGSAQCEGMTTGSDRRWHPPAHLPKMPLMLGFVARKPKP